MILPSFLKDALGSSEPPQTDGGDKFIGTDLPPRPSAARRRRDQQKEVKKRGSLFSGVDIDIKESWQVCLEWVNSHPPEKPVPRKVIGKTLHLTKSKEKLVNARHKQLKGGCHVLASPLETDFTQPDQLEGRVADHLESGKILFFPTNTPAETSTAFSLVSSIDDWGKDYTPPVPLDVDVDEDEDLFGLHFDEVNLNDNVKMPTPDTRQPVHDDSWSPSILSSILPLMDFTGKKKGAIPNGAGRGSSSFKGLTSKISELTPSAHAGPDALFTARSTSRDKSLGVKLPFECDPSTPVTKLESSITPNPSSSTITYHPHKLLKELCTPLPHDKPRPESVPLSIPSVDSLEVAMASGGDGTRASNPSSLHIPILHTLDEEPSVIELELRIPLPLQPKKNEDRSKGKSKAQEIRVIPPQKPPPVHVQLPDIPSHPFAKKSTSSKRSADASGLTIRERKLNEKGQQWRQSAVTSMNALADLQLPAALNKRRNALTPLDIPASLRCQRSRSREQLSNEPYITPLEFLDRFFPPDKYPPPEKTPHYYSPQHQNRSYEPPPRPLTVRDSSNGPLPPADGISASDSLVNEKDLPPVPVEERPRSRESIYLDNQRTKIAWALPLALPPKMLLKKREHDRMLCEMELELAPLQNTPAKIELASYPVFLPGLLAPESPPPKEPALERILRRTSVTLSPEDVVEVQEQVNRVINEEEEEKARKAAQAERRIRACDRQNTCPSLFTSRLPAPPSSYRVSPSLRSATPSCIPLSISRPTPRSPPVTGVASHDESIEMSVPMHLMTIPPTSTSPTPAKPSTFLTLIPPELRLTAPTPTTLSPRLPELSVCQSPSLPTSSNTPQSSPSTREAEAQGEGMLQIPPPCYDASQRRRAESTSSSSSRSGRSRSDSTSSSSEEVLISPIPAAPSLTSSGMTTLGTPIVTVPSARSRSISVSTSSMTPLLRTTSATSVLSSQSGSFRTRAASTSSRDRAQPSTTSTSTRAVATRGQRGLLPSAWR